MADLKKIKERISELVERRENVTLSEIKWVVDRLGEEFFRQLPKALTGPTQRRFRIPARDRLHQPFQIPQ